MSEPINEISFNIDFQDRRTIRLDFTPVQNDSQTYKFIMTPYKNEVAYTLDAGWTYTISVRRPNNTSVIDSATVDGTDIVYTLGASFLEQYGVHKCTVEIFDGTKRLTSNTFMWDTLQEHGGDEAITNTNEYPILTELIDDMEASNALWEEDDGEIAPVDDVDLNLGTKGIIMTDATLGGEFVISLDDGILVITPK